MAGLQITITDAGRAALPNGPNTGTSAVTISHVGVSSVHTPGSLKGLTALPGEVKRVTTFGGDIVADDVIHVTINDETTAVYSVRSFGLYLSTGVLFAVFSSPDIVVEKSAGAMVLLSADITFKTLDTAVIQFGGTGFINPTATTERVGVVELATWEEAAAGARADVVVTPFGLLKTLQSWATNFAAAVHRHTLGEIDGLPEALAGKAAAGHKHDASDTNTGVFDVGRIPALAMEKITGLAAALAGKAPTLHTHPLTDLAPFFRAGLETGVDLGNANLENQRSARLVAVNNGSNVISLSIRLSSGDVPVERALLQADGALFLAGSRVWTAALFNPALKADIASPALTGTPTAPTAAAGTNTLQIATTAFVSSALITALQPKADLASPAFTGVPTAPTAAAGTNTTQLATTAFVSAGLSLKADLNSPAFAGVPTAPTAAAGTNTTQLATTAFVQAGLSAGLAPKAPLASPGLTGTPTAPTAPTGTNTTQLATTAFVQTGLNLKVSKAGDKMTGLLEMPQLRLKEAGTGNTNSGATIQSKYYGDDQYGFSFLVNKTTGPSEVAVLDYTGALYLNGARTWTTALLTAASAAEAAAGAAVDRFITPAALWSFARSLGKPAYAVIPGTGLMIQCGSTTGNFAEGEAHTTLPVAFGGGCIAAVAIPQNASSNLASNYFMQVVSKNLDRIVFYANRSDSSSGNISGFDWVAIGLVSGTPDPAYSGGSSGGGGGGGQTNPV